MQDQPRYRIMRELGRGAMGTVHLAEDRQLGRRVAIKRVRLPEGDPEEALRRFHREARTLAMLQVPHLVRVYDCEFSRAKPCMVMEYVPGRTLAEVLEGGPLSLPKVLRMAREVGAALVALHEQGILHRDLKPANVMLREPEEDAVLMDLGLARATDLTVLTRTGLVLGTPRYLPPEVVVSVTWTPRSDLFQLAAVLFEALGGVCRVPGEDLGELMEALKSGRLQPFPDGPRSRTLQAVVEALERASAADPSARPADVRAFLAELEVAAAGGAARRGSKRRGRAHSARSRRTSTPDRSTPSPGPGPRLRRAVAGLAAGTLLGLVVAGLGSRLLPASPAEGRSPALLVPGPLPSPIEERAHLGPAHTMLLECTRPATAWWRSVPDTVWHLIPGRLALDAPPDPGETLTLVWDARGRQGSRSWSTAELHEDAVARLEGQLSGFSVQGFLDEHVRSLDRNITLPAPELAAWRDLRRWLPELLGGPLPRSRRLGLWARWQEWRRLALALFAMGEEVPGLAALATPGARDVYPGLPSWEPTIRRPLAPVLPDWAERMPRDLLTLGAPWAWERDRPADSRYSSRARFPWPENPPDATHVAVSLRLNRLRPIYELVISPEEASVPGPALAFRHPTPFGGDEEKYRGWLTVELPISLAPPSGAAMQIAKRPLAGPLLFVHHETRLWEMVVAWGRASSAPGTMAP